MRQVSTGQALAFAVVCVVLGILAAPLFDRGITPGPGRGFPIGLPELIIFAVPIVFVAFWVLLIGGILRAMGWIGPGRYYRRMEDLPADFDDWHRRAHERMRETAPADDPGRRG